MKRFINILLVAILITTFINSILYYQSKVEINELRKAELRLSIELLKLKMDNEHTVYLYCK